MKKVRVLKEMPFAKVGEVFDEVKPYSTTGLFVLNGFSIDDELAERWVKLGWLSWVEEEKSLDDILHEDLYGYFGSSGCLALEQKIIDHFKAIFDKAVENHSWNGIESTKSHIYSYYHIRKAMFGED